MALVILGGLLTSAALNLLVLPVLALRYGRFEPAIDELSTDRHPLALPNREAAESPIPKRSAQAIARTMSSSADQTIVARKDNELIVNAAGANVQVDALSKTYGRFQALDGVGFSIRPGEILGLIGPNGAGKTTLFECVAGLEAADAGSVSFSNGGGNGRLRSSRLFYVPDGVAPWPDQPVRWVLEYSLDFFGGREEIFNQVIADLALAALMHVPIRALSKGQRKRTLLALGLLAPQPILLIDEPFEGLDLRQSREAAATLRRHITPDRTFFLSIHQIADAAKVCDRFVLLSGGRIVAEGTLDVLTDLARQRRGHTLPADFEEVFLALA
jgi:ABC-2 type transport system ATP-binding protein